MAMHMKIEPYQMPKAAVDDYGEYLRQGGRFSLEVWWERYKDDYARSSGSDA